MKIGLNEITDLCSSIESYELSGDLFLKGLFIGLNIVIIFFCIIHRIITLIKLFFVLIRVKHASKLMRTSEKYSATTLHNE